jgi:hypothetical protein
LAARAQRRSAEYKIVIKEKHMATHEATTGRKSGSLFDLVLTAVFGKLVRDDEAARKSPTWRYHKRRNKLVVLNSLVILALATVCVWGAASRDMALGIAVGFAFLWALNVYALAAASDALLVSLFERINLQSTWLHARLTEIEVNTSKDGKLKGQERWETWRKDEDSYNVAGPERWDSVKQSNA